MMAQKPVLGLPGACQRIRAPQLQAMFHQHILIYKVRKKAVRRFANSAERAKRLG